METKKTVLFIDDNQDFLTLSSEELESNIYEIKTILISGEQPDLVQKIKDIQPDLIFLDVLFSKKFSNSLANQMREESELKEVPIYLISFLDIGEIMAIANKKVVNGCFMKPIKREDIAMLFKKHFDMDVPIEE